MGNATIVIKNIDAERSYDSANHRQFNLSMQRASEYTCFRVYVYQLRQVEHPLYQSRIQKYQGRKYHGPIIQLCPALGLPASQSRLLPKRTNPRHPSSFMWTTSPGFPMSDPLPKLGLGLRSMHVTYCVGMGMLSSPDPC